MTELLTGLFKEIMNLIQNKTITKTVFKIIHDSNQQTDLNQSPKSTSKPNWGIPKTAKTATLPKLCTLLQFSPVHVPFRVHSGQSYKSSVQRVQAQRHNFALVVCHPERQSMFRGVDRRATAKKRSHKRNNKGCFYLAAYRNFFRGKPARNALAR